MTRFEIGKNYKVTCADKYTLTFKVIDKGTCFIDNKPNLKLILVDIKANCDMSKQPYLFKLLKTYYDFTHHNHLTIHEGITGEYVYLDGENSKEFMLLS